MWSNSTVRICERVNCSKGPWMWSRSRLIAAHVDSMAELSKQSPVEDHDARMFQSLSRLVNSSDVYCEPRSA